MLVTADITNYDYNGHKYFICVAKDDYTEENNLVFTCDYCKFALFVYKDICSFGYYDHILDECHRMVKTKHIYLGEIPDNQYVFSMEIDISQVEQLFDNFVNQLKNMEAIMIKN